MKNKLVVFKGKEIRRVLHNNEWWFAIVDVVSDLTDSVGPSDYIKDKTRSAVDKLPKPAVLAREAMGELLGILAEPGGEVDEEKAA